MLEQPKENGISNLRNLGKIDFTKIHVKWIGSSNIKNYFKIVVSSKRHFFILSSIPLVEILVINANNQEKTMSRIRIYFLLTPTQNLLTTVKIITLKDRNPLSFE